MSSFVKINEELPYKEKINHTISYLPDEDKTSFKKALKYYKFDKEVYIPQTMTLNKKEYKKKNYLLNTIVNFNNKLQLGKNYITSLKKQTDKFSKQYQLVEKQNEANQKAFFQGINYIYKIRGYSDRNISYSRNENIFDPSLLLEEQNKFNFVCKTENPIEIKQDTIYLEKFHSIIRDKKGKSKEEEEELEKKNINKSVTFVKRQDSSLIGDDYTKSMENVKKQIMEEIRIKNMTFSELKRINDNLKNQIMETESSLMNIDEEYKNKIRYNDNVFLSSKGMLRSAKNRYKDKDDIDKKDKSKKNILIIDKNIQNKNEDSNLKEEKKEDEKNEEEKKEEDKKEEEKKEEENKEDNNKMKKEVHFERNKKITLTERQRREAFQKAKETKLTKIYNSVLKRNYKQEENEIRNYIKLYTNRIAKDPDSNKGSNLHGFLNDFQKQITKTNIPEMANYVGEAMANINRLNRLNKNSNELNIIESCVNPELLYDMDENINNLGYDYAEEILRK